MEKLRKQMNRNFYLRFFFLSNWTMKKFLQSERGYLQSRFSVGEYSCLEDVFRDITISKNSDEKNI